MSPKRSTRISIRVPKATVVGARLHAGRRGLSSFIARAMEHELAREARNRCTDRCLIAA